MSARRFLKRKYGKIYIRFNEPFSLKEYLLKNHLELKDCHHNLATHITGLINQVSLVTPLSLISTAILTSHKRGFYLSELQKSSHILMDFINKEGIPVSKTLVDPPKAVLETVALLMGWKVIEFMEDTPEDEETFYFVDDDKKMELEYYKNNIIHFFIYHSFVALSLLKGTEELKSIDDIISDYIFLKEIMTKEFIFHEQENISHKVDSILEYFVNSGLLVKSHGDSLYKITKQGFDQLPVWSDLIKTFIESYWITSLAILKNKDMIDSGEHLLKSIRYFGKRYYKQGIIEHVGAISRFSYQNAVSLFTGMLSKDTNTTAEDKKYDFKKLSNISKNLYGFLHHAR